MGASSFGYDIARQFGLNICQTKPGLVPLLLNAKDRSAYCDLAGVSAEVTAAANGATFRESMLITHRGLSGPAILQASSYWNPPAPIHLDLAPQRDVFLPLREDPARGAAQVRSALHEILPKRFATKWLELHTPSSWSNAALEELERELHDWAVLPAGTEGYDKAEVTTGGVEH